MQNIYQHHHEEKVKKFLNINPFISVKPIKFDEKNVTIYYKFILQMPIRSSIRK